MKKFLLLEVTMAMLASLAGRAAPAGDPLDHWQQLNPDVNLYDLREVRFGGNRWVAINHGYLPSPPLILSSLDGTNWVRTYQAPAGYLMRSLDFGGSRWIATAADNSGNSSVVTSEDGLVWTPIPNVRFYQVSYGNGRWLALGYGSTFFRSVDGITWQEARSELALPLEDNPSLVFGDGQWLALGLRFSSGGTQPQQELISSPDGDTWTVHPLPDEVRDPASHRGFPASLAYGNGSWVLQYGSCSGPAGPCTNVIWKSDDGRTWERLILDGGSLDRLSFAHRPGGGLWFEQKYLYDYLNGVNPSRICVSTDLTHWDCSPVPADAVGTILWAGDRWARSVQADIFTSTNGLDWSSASASVPTLAIAYGQQKWLGISGDRYGPGNSYLLASADAREWSRVKTFSVQESPIDLAFADGLWVIGGMAQREPSGLFTNFFILTSTNGASWTEAAVPPGPLGNMRTLRHTEKGWIAFMSASGTFLGPYPNAWLLRSQNGRNWEWQELGPLPHVRVAALREWYDVTYGNGKWFASTMDVESVSSINWREIIFSSDDLRDWQPWSSPAAVVSRLEFAHGLWFGMMGPAAGDCCPEYSIVTSPDALSWKPRYKFGKRGGSTVRMGDGRLTALHSIASVLQSDPLLSVEQNRPGNLVIRRAAGIPVVVESSEDLRQWHTLTNLPLGDAVQKFADPTAKSSTAQFYRARTP